MIAYISRFVPAGGFNECFAHPGLSNNLFSWNNYFSLRCTCILYIFNYCID